MKEVFVIFPVHLFPKEKLKYPSMTHILVEEPIYFGDHEIKMKFNQIKLTFHRASMKYYQDYLKSSKGKKIATKYIDYQDVDKYKFLAKYDTIHFFDVVDNYLMKKIQKYVETRLKKKCVIHENPGFLTSTSDLKEYYKNKNKDRYSHHLFYRWQLQKLKTPYLKDLKKSYDDENRNKLPKNIKVPDLPRNPDYKSKYVREAIKYVKKHFPKNYGHAENLIFPITHTTSKKWLHDFFKVRFAKFGVYQDAIDEKNAFLFHSLLAPMINVGLLPAEEVYQEAVKYYQKNKSQVKINNYEGFIRQLIGWREYQRFLYIFEASKMRKSNYFGHRRKLTSDWYTGNTGILPVDTAIKQGFKYGYLHHIQRLMVMSNIMNLMNFHPHQVYQWMMEFSCDSYDWVMVGNVYSMGMWADGGLTMRKPYFSSDNYILKMSNYPKGKWCDIWKALYYYFLNQQYQELKKTPYVRNLSHWKKMSSSQQESMTKLAKSTIKKLTK